jgi:hypothetical protein
MDDLAVAPPQLWPPVGRALLEGVELRGRELGAVQTVVVASQSDASKREMLAALAFSPASEWWMRGIG